MFKYLSLLRASAFPAWYQKELATMSATQFRFQEKKRPDQYAVWAAEVMTWPVPPELTIAGPQLIWDWDGEGEGGREMREMLEGLRIGKGRVVLMGRGEELEKLPGGGEWSKEPWYGTEYRVEKFDDAFIAEASGDCLVMVLTLMNFLSPFFSRAGRGAERYPGALPSWT
jgi:insulysin